jgi:hypothetical protein
MFRNRTKLLLVLAIGLALAIPADSFAHWCSNIYRTYARIVVKPDRQTIDVSDGSTGELKVRVRNNFPYTMEYILMRVNPPAELTVDVSPTEAEALNIRVYAGQEVTFTLSITRTGAGSNDVADLNLEVRPRVEGISNWRDMSDIWVEQNYSESAIRNSIANNPQQTHGLLNADLADIDSCPGCELDGVTELIAIWNSIDVDYNDTWGQQVARAGQALAIRLRYRTSNDPARSALVQAMLDEMDGSFDIARGTAAFFAAYGGNDAAAVTRINEMASSDSSTSAQRMAKAAQLLLGDNTTADVTACYQDGGEEIRARAVCAAALGIMGDDDPIANFLIGEVTFGADGDSYPPRSVYYNRHYAGYMLQLVVFVRRGGPEGVGVVSFYDEDVVVDDVAPAAPTGLTVQPP